MIHLQEILGLIHQEKDEKKVLTEMDKGFRCSRRGTNGEGEGESTMKTKY